MQRIVQTLFLAGVLGLLASTAASASEQLKSPGTIRITSREVKTTRIDLRPGGLSVGDVEVERALLYNTRVTPKPIGHAEMVCTFVVKTSRNCNATFFLPKGKIVVSGPIFYRQLFELAVTGGTGLYDNVRGSLTVTSLGKKPRRDLLFFRLNIG
jgi:hypothetical protein